MRAYHVSAHGTFMVDTRLPKIYIKTLNYSLQPAILNTMGIRNI